jgi:GTP-binding protein Era
MPHHSGFVAVLGRPNVGKSTLVNALVGEKISIVTSKPNTTRHAILGVLSRPDWQIIFIDTPGLTNKQQRLIDKAMNRAATGALVGANIVLFMVEAGTWSAADKGALQLIKQSGLECILAVNKIDKIKPKEKLLPYLQARAADHDYLEIVPLSALGNDNLELLAQQIATHLPIEEPLYPAEMLTDKGIQFRVAEVVREKLMDSLRQELPYGVGVEIELLEDTPQRLNVSAIVWVGRESHKGIVIGPGGKAIKHVGQSARLDLQEILQRKVHLETLVKVKRNWADNAQWIQQLGYGSME